MSEEVSELARVRCGIYGEDTLVVRRLPGGAVEIERQVKDGQSRRWTVGASSSLRVSSEMWGAVPMVGVETDLELDGASIAHFEFDFTSGGTHDEAVAKLAVAIAEHAKCALDIQPLRIPGEQHLATIRCGHESREQLHAIKDERGAVRIVNAMSLAQWKIAASDTLVVAASVRGSADDGVSITLERGAAPSERIGHFGTISAAMVVAFASRVADVARCTVVHREPVRKQEPS